MGSLPQFPGITPTPRHGFFTCQQCGEECENLQHRKIRIFCSKKCRADYERSTPENPVRKIQAGYVMLCWLRGPATRDTGKYKCRFEHDCVWEKAHGPIPSGYVIHHKNENKQDNRLDNLQLMTNGDHIRLHNLQRPPYKTKVPRKYASKAEQNAEYAKRAKEKRARRNSGLFDELTQDPPTPTTTPGGGGSLFEDGEGREETN